jgi:hypothetical protein
MSKKGTKREMSSSLWNIITKMEEKKNEYKQKDHKNSGGCEDKCKDEASSTMGSCDVLLYIGRRARSRKSSNNFGI